MALRPNTHRMSLKFLFFVFICFKSRKRLFPIDESSEFNQEQQQFSDDIAAYLASTYVCLTQIEL
uniref:Uncharacterized protein n=1 Tax=Meloidogyne enterolobii TaxID=390850 RepID=A0A6V7VGQ5_MELEN|nr:unnamed protein product [Meloidogyne enterolobii]